MRMDVFNLFPAATSGACKNTSGRKRVLACFLPGHYRQRDDAVPVPMEPGDGVFFSALTIHGSGPNESHRDRRMNTFAYKCDGK